MHICLTVHPQVKCLNEMLESRMAQRLDFFFLILEHLLAIMRYPGDGT